jgi:hypothetical protein
VRLIPGHAWLLAAALPGFAGGLAVTHDAVRLLAASGWTLHDLPSLFALGGAVTGGLTMAASVMVLLRYRLGWSVLLALCALCALLGVLVLLGRQAVGLGLVGAGLLEGVLLWRGRRALL